MKCLIIPYAAFSYREYYYLAFDDAAVPSEVVNYLSLMGEEEILHHFYVNRTTIIVNVPRSECVDFIKLLGYEFRSIPGDVDIENTNHISFEEYWDVGEEV